MALRDSDMQPSVEKVRKSLTFFLGIYEQYHHNIGVFFGIKKKVVEGDAVSHLWYAFKGMRDGRLTGEHLEPPKALLAHKTVAIDPAEVEDWMINNHGRLYGGYSIRIQRELSPESKRADFDAYTGITEYVDPSVWEKLTK